MRGASRLAGRLAIVSVVASVLPACGGSSRTTESITIPTTTPPVTVVVTAAGGLVTVVGTEDFVAQVSDAIDLASSAVPDLFEELTASLDSVEWTRARPGVDVERRAALIDDESAFTTGASQEVQLMWLVGVLVHQSCHSARHRDGLEEMGTDAELACLRYQREALADVGGPQGYLAYLDFVIAAVDDPENSYWADPDRHW